jgi:hypothetical protein
MKTGRPGYRLPSPQTVSRDVKSVFLKVRKRIAKTLQVGLSFRLLLNANKKLTKIN